MQQLYSSGTGISVSSSASSIYIKLPNYGPATTFSWTTSNQSGSVYYSAYGRTATINLNAGASIIVHCSISNSCGSTQVSFNCYNYSYSMAVYPNPTNQELNVATVNDPQATEDKEFASEKSVDEKDLADVDADIQILDKNNTAVRQGKLKKGKITFSTLNLPSDTYFLRFDDGKKIIKKQIVIRH